MATERWVLGGGGAGGSKTFAGSRLFIKQFLVEQKRYEDGEITQSLGWALFLRRTMPELLQVVADFKRYKDLVGPNHWDAQRMICTFENGFRVQFGGMEHEDDYLKFYGNAYTLVVIDEATQFTKKQIVEIDARLRCTDPILSKMLQLYMLTNPVGGATKAWLKRRFLSVPPETPIVVRVKLKDGRIIQKRRVYIPCNLYDNPALADDGNYETTLMLKSPAMRRALLENDWDVDEGSCFGDEWDTLVHVCKPFTIPRTWTRYKCGDYGFGTSRKGHRTSVMWFAVDHEGNHVCYRSFSCRGLTVHDLSATLKEIERRPLVYRDKGTGAVVPITSDEWDEKADMSTVRGPFDSQMWGDVGETGQTRGDILDAWGLGFYACGKGAGARHTAAEHFRNLLRRRTPDKDGSLDPGIPGIRFFSSCVSVLQGEDGEKEETGPIKTIPGLAADKNDPDVWDTKADDDDMDALAYYLNSQPQPGKEIEESRVLDWMSAREIASEDKPINW